MNYLEYFELASEPFSNAPVSRFYYNSQQHADALMRLRYCVDNMKGLALLVGEICARLIFCWRCITRRKPWMRPGW